MYYCLPLLISVRYSCIKFYLAAFEELAYIITYEWKLVVKQSANVTLRVQDCFNRPISSAPNAWIDVVERYSNDNNRTLL